MWRLVALSALESPFLPQRSTQHTHVVQQHGAGRGGAGVAAVRNAEAGSAGAACAPAPRRVVPGGNERTRACMARWHGLVAWPLARPAHTCAHTFILDQLALTGMRGHEQVDAVAAAA